MPIRARPHAAAGLLLLVVGLLIDGPFHGALVAIQLVQVAAIVSGGFLLLVAASAWGSTLARDDADVLRHSGHSVE